MLIVILLTLILIYILYKIYKKKKVHQFLLIYFAFSAFLWVIFPSIVSLIGDRYKQELVVKENVFITYAIYEFLFYIILLLLLYRFPLCKPFYYGKYIPNTSSSIKRIWFVLSLFLIINIIKQISSNVTYSEVNDSTILAEQETNLFSIFSNFSICLYLTIILFYNKLYSKRIIFFSWLLLSLNIITVLAHGARMQVIFYLFVFVYYLFSSALNKKRFFLYMSFLIGIIYLCSYIFPAVAYIRSGGNFTVEDLRKSYENYGEANAFVLQLLIKSNSINTGAILVEETKEKPYLNPYINSIYSFCPSILFPGKRPLAGSSDGTIDGFPTRLAAEYISGDSRFFNVGISTSATALWHGGILFYVINLVIVFFWYRFLNSLMFYENYYAKLLVVYFTVLGYFILPTADVLIRDLLKQPFFYAFFIFISRGGLIKDWVKSLKRHIA